MDERFETDLRAGYPDDASGAILGSPMLDGEVLAGVRVRFPLSNVNRHGLVAGATGTGKTKTLQVIAGQLSDAGVPVFVADVKGDLSGTRAADRRRRPEGRRTRFLPRLDGRAPLAPGRAALADGRARRAGPCGGRVVRARAARQGARPEPDPDRRALARVQVLRRPRSAAARPGRSPHDPATGSEVTAYVIDTGIRFSHQEFDGRATSGFDAIDGGSADCHGHGTHVAGTIGGSTYGVAKQVNLVAVRVLNCQGSGSTSQVVAGIDWVTQDHDPGEAAVANMSLGGSASTAMDQAVSRSIIDGVTYAIAAGNGNILGLAANACNSSPARVAAALTVSATDSTDTKASWANIGTCIDVFAPGVNITSAWSSDDTATNTISDTSMATPHVAGVVATYLETDPTATPAQVASTITSSAIKGS